MDYETKQIVRKEFESLGYTEVWAEVWHNKESHYIFEYHYNEILIYKNENMGLGKLIRPDGTVILDTVYNISDMLQYARNLKRKETLKSILN
jgi:hypothetical protein